MSFVGSNEEDEGKAEKEIDVSGVTDDTSISSSCSSLTSITSVIQSEPNHNDDFFVSEEDNNEEEENQPFISQKIEVYTIHDLTTSSGLCKVKGWKGFFVKTLNYFCFRNQPHSYVDYVIRQCNSKTIQKEIKTVHDLLLNVNDWASVITNEENIYIKNIQQCEENLFQERDKYTYNFAKGLPTAQILNNIETLAKRREIMLRHLSKYIRPLCIVIENYKSDISENIINASFVRTAEGATEVSHKAETLKKRLMNARKNYRVTNLMPMDHDEIDIDTSSFVNNFLSTGKMRDEPRYFNSN